MCLDGVCTRLMLFICPPEHRTPGMCLPVRFNGPPQHGSKNTHEGCLLLLAQLSWGEQSSVLAMT